VKNLKNIHTNFTLNGNIFTSEETLLVYSKSISKEVYSFLTDWFSDDNFIEVKTSGSTGKPKVIQLKKEHMYNSALATGTFFNLNEKTTALHCLPTNFIAGKMMLVRALVLGWHLDVVNPNSNPLDDTTKQYDFCAMIPLQVQNSISKLYRIKKLIIGGATISNRLLDKLKSIKIDAFETYGMTETITHIAVKQLNTKNDCHPERSRRISFLKSQYITEKYFEVLPNVKISLDNRGCLLIDAPKISDDKIVTNDLVNIIDTTHFEWLGRFDTIINSGGVKIIPEVVEQKLAAILPFRFFITGIFDEKLGEKVVLICEGKTQDLDSFKIENYLSRFEKPKAVFFIQKFIETQNNKLSRIETLRMLKN